MRILVVDDNPTVLKQINVYLGGEHNVMLAKSGEHALKILQKEEPDVILLDIMMPEMDGFETLGRIRAAGIDAPVVFVTGDDCDTSFEKAADVGVKVFIRKPPNKDELLSAIAKAAG